MRIADFREALRNRENGEILWIAIGHFFPIKWSRNASIWERAHRIGRACCAILRVLVVVKKDAMTLFLPPFRTGQGGGPALDRARKGHSRTANFRESPTWFDAYIHVHTAR